MRSVICVIVTSVMWIAGYLTYQFYYPPDSPEPEIRTITTTRYIPTNQPPVFYPVRVPVPVYTDTSPQLPVLIDTSAVIDAYFKRVAYTDTAVNDTSALIVITDTLHRNQITSRAVMFQNRRAVQTITTNYHPPPDCPRWNIGAGIHYTSGTFTPAIQLTTHRFTFTVSGLTGSVSGSVVYNLR